MQAELEKLKQDAADATESYLAGYIAGVDAVSALLAGKVLCDGIAVDCPECSGDGYHWGRVNRANKRIGCPACNETGKLYAPASHAGNADIGKEGGECPECKQPKGLPYGPYCITCGRIHGGGA